MIYTSDYLSRIVGKNLCDKDYRSKCSVVQISIVHIFNEKEYPLKYSVCVYERNALPITNNQSYKGKKDNAIASPIALHRSDIVPGKVIAI